MEPKATWSILRSPTMSLHLDTTDGLRAVVLENRLTGHRISLGRGPELEVDWDSADRRIWVEGWRCRPTDIWDGHPDDERGFREGYAKAEFDDSHLATPYPDAPETFPVVDDEGCWECFESPCDLHVPEPRRYAWARTHLYVPPDSSTKPLTLVLGGMDLYDFRFMRVFLNGIPIGQRRADRRWNEPARFDLSRGTPAASAIRFGRDNVLALQLRGQITRTAALDARDPHGARHFPVPGAWCAPFLQCLVIGPDVHTPTLTVTDVKIAADALACEIDLGDPAGGTTARVSYRLSPEAPLLRKSIRITNTSGRPMRLMNIRHGAHRVDLPVSEGGRGFPVYLSDEAFVSLADPAGWTTGEEGEIRLRQFPGRLLQPGESFAGMDTFWGVAERGGAQRSFVEMIRRRCRRVRRGHDKPIAIFEPFGGWDISAGSGNSWVEESAPILNFLLDRLVEARKESGLQFDLFSVDFWVDKHGDLTGFDPRRFPDGFAPIRDRIRTLGMHPGLWIDSSMSGWHIADNPAIVRTFTHNPSYTPKFWCGAYTCRATEPIRTFFCAAFRHHIRENGVRMAKYDNLRSICNNIAHDHLPGVYSTEAIHDGVRQMLREMDAENPDVFLMLYWGYRSPWWLLEADTLFEPGLGIEAATPGIRPTLYARDGVTQGLDLAHQWCADLPPIGKDSLGVWLSAWDWNSEIGTDRWMEGFIMDLARGSLLAQPWSDRNFLDAPQRRQMVVLLECLRQNAECFARSRLILGNPWQQEPYGYCGYDGTRGFIAINNTTWEDRSVILCLDERWGLPGHRKWQIYRRHPHPARLAGKTETFTGEVMITLRPFEVILLELVPDGGNPRPQAQFEVATLPGKFTEASRRLKISCSPLPPDQAVPLANEHPPRTPTADTSQTIRVDAEIPSCAGSALLAVTLEIRQSGRLVCRPNPGHHCAAAFTLTGQPVNAQPVLGRGHPAGWQAWRITLPPADIPRRISARLTATAAATMELYAAAFFIPTQVPP